MRSLLEFALFAWVGISVIAVLIQLVRIARYKRGAESTASATEPAASRPAPTIDLKQRLADQTPAETPPPGQLASAEPAPTAPAKTATAAGAATTAAGAATTAAAPTAGASSAPTAVPAPVVEQPLAQPAPSATPETIDAPSGAPAGAPSPEASPDHAVADSSPTLADLLAGVRLPWNLLPTVDQSREPSNDRVVLITDEGEPADIGVDVADELERLGFEITPRGDDVAIATRGEHALGLQIIPDPTAAVTDGVQRFPNASEASVALDIWIE